jgi:hypothetical protein
MVSGSDFMFCAPKLIFGGTEGDGSRFHVLRSWTHFRRYRGRRVPFSCFALPDPFSTIKTASGPILMFRAQGPVFGCTNGAGCRFHVLHSRTRFRRYRGRPVTFSYFAFPDPYSTVPTPSGPVFMFCAPGPVFDGTDGVGSRFPLLRSRTNFWRYRRRRVPFACFALPNTFSAVKRVLGPFFMFCAPGFIFGGTEGIMSRFHVLRSRTRFQ